MSLRWACWISLAALLCGASPTSAAPVRLTPKEAVSRALKYNLGFKATRLDPALTEEAERIAEASYSPSLFGGLDVAGSDRAKAGVSGATSVGADVGMRKLFSVGTSLEGSLSTSALYGGSRLDPSYESGLKLSARQALLQGISRKANEAPIVSARLARDAANASLERQAELLAAETLKAYWDLRASAAKVVIQDVALQMAEKTLRETTALIGAGKLPATEQSSSDYAVKRQRRSKIQAEQELQNARDRMARLIGMVPADSLATPEIVPISAPRGERSKTTLPELQRQAMKDRGDFRTLKIATELRRVEEQVAHHKLLPKLDLVAALQLTGLSGDPKGTSGSDSDYRSYWGSFAMNRLTWSAGLSLEVPLGNKEAKARRELAALAVRRSVLATEMAIQELALELNIAYRAVQTNREALRLSEEAMKVAEAKLAAETERYKAGKTSAHILADVQLQAITERTTREQALADMVKSVVELQATAGTLLSRLGLRSNGQPRDAMADDHGPEPASSPGDGRNHAEPQPATRSTK